MIKLSTTAQHYRVPKVHSRTTCLRTAFLGFNPVRRRHLHLGSIYFFFELIKITLNSQLQRTFTNTRGIGTPVMAVTEGVLLHVPSDHQRGKSSQQLCLLRGT